MLFQFCFEAIKIIKFFQVLNIYKKKVSLWKKIILRSRQDLNSKGFVNVS